MSGPLFIAIRATDPPQHLLYSVRDPWPLGVSPMRRREFIALLSSSAVAWPLAARAQKNAMPVIGYLHSGSAGPYAHLVAAFQQGLKETGTVEGSNVAIEYRW